MKVELIRDGKVIDTVVGGKPWIDEILPLRIQDWKDQKPGVEITTREIPDDTSGMLKTVSGKPFWMD